MTDLTVPPLFAGLHKPKAKVRRSIRTRLPKPGDVFLNFKNNKTSTSKVKKPNSQTQNRTLIGRQSLVERQSSRIKTGFEATPADAPRLMRSAKEKPNLDTGIFGPNLFTKAPEPVKTRIKRPKIEDPIVEITPADAPRLMRSAKEKPDLDTGIFGPNLFTKAPEPVKTKRAITKTTSPKAKLRHSSSSAGIAQQTTPPVQSNSSGKVYPHWTREAIEKSNVADVKMLFDSYTDKAYKNNSTLRSKRPANFSLTPSPFTIDGNVGTSINAVYHHGRKNFASDFITSLYGAKWPEWAKPHKDGGVKDKRPVIQHLLRRLARNPNLRDKIVANKEMNEAYIFFEQEVENSSEFHNFSREITDARQILKQSQYPQLRPLADALSVRPLGPKSEKMFEKILKNGKSTWKKQIGQTYFNLRPIFKSFKKETLAIDEGTANSSLDLQSPKLTESSELQQEIIDTDTASTCSDTSSSFSGISRDGSIISKEAVYANSNASTSSISDAGLSTVISNEDKDMALHEKLFTRRGTQSSSSEQISSLREEPLAPGLIDHFTPDILGRYPKKLRMRVEEYKKCDNHHQKNQHIVVSRPIEKRKQEFRNDSLERFWLSLDNLTS